MQKIKEAIVVEGRYDKNKLSQLVDTLILTTEGFGIFHNKALQKTLRTIAQKQGLIVLTDSDGAGFVIRNFIRSLVEPQYLRHAYIPDIYGKERRKDKPSKEGKLGVEGIPDEVLLECLQSAAVFTDAVERPDPITKTDLFRLGMTGGANSAGRRAALIDRLQLPEHITTNALLGYLNVLLTRDDFLQLAAELAGEKAAPTEG